MCAWDVNKCFRCKHQQQLSQPCNRQKRGQRVYNAWLGGGAAKDEHTTIYACSLPDTEAQLHVDFGAHALVNVKPDIALPKRGPLSDCENIQDVGAFYT